MLATTMRLDGTMSLSDNALTVQSLHFGINRSQCKSISTCGYNSKHQTPNPKVYIHLFDCEKWGLLPSLPSNDSDANVRLTEENNLQLLLPTPTRALLVSVVDSHTKMTLSVNYKYLPENGSSKHKTVIT